MRDEAHAARILEATVKRGEAASHLEDAHPAGDHTNRNAPRLAKIAGGLRHQMMITVHGPHALPAL